MRTKHSKPRLKEPDALRIRLGKNLRTARLALEPGLTQREIGNMFEPPVAPATVCQWEDAKTAPTVDRLAILSKIYGRTLDELVFGTVRKRPAKGRSKADA